MFIFIYYVFIFIYTYLFGLLFNLDYTNYTNPWLYVLFLAALLLGAVCSFITIMVIIVILGEFRKNKGMDNLSTHRLANSILKLGLHLIRTKVILTGKENIPKGKFILVGNHVENYDIIILKPLFNDHVLNFIAKEALIKLPIFGKWITFLGNVFISREADRSAAESIIKGIRHYKSGISMGIFPEGKRSFSNEMIDFKPGAFKLAMKPKADILIATQYDTCKIFKSIPFRKYRVYVHIHPLLPYTEYEGMKSQEISKMVKARIQVQLDFFKEQYN